MPAAWRAPNGNITWLDGRWTVFYLIERVPKDVADARRYDEASPVEKIDIDIGRLQQRTMALKRLGAGKEAFAELAEETAELDRRKGELQAAQSHVAVSF